MPFLSAYIACIVLFLYSTCPDTLRFFLLDPGAEATSCSGKDVVCRASGDKCLNFSFRSKFLKAERCYESLAKYPCIWNVPYLSTLRVPIVHAQ
jgi:hypothetical protein